MDERTDGWDRGGWWSDLFLCLGLVGRGGDGRWTFGGPLFPLGTLDRFCLPVTGRAKGFCAMVCCAVLCCAVMCLAILCRGVMSQDKGREAGAELTLEVTHDGDDDDGLP